MHDLEASVVLGKNKLEQSKNFKTYFFFWHFKSFDAKTACLQLQFLIDTIIK